MLTAVKSPLMKPKHEIVSGVGSASQNYPDYYDKLELFPKTGKAPLLYTGGHETDYQRNKRSIHEHLSLGIIPRCTQGYVKGRCTKGHTFYKAVFCHREYCPDCGKNGSLPHQRRVKRWNPKVQAVDALGYLVVTIPDTIREYYQNTLHLSAFRVALKRKLKKMGYQRGFMRWHLFGDCNTCEGKGCLNCKGTGAGRVYKPHLNIMIDQGFMLPDEFESFKSELAAFLVNYWRKTCRVKCEANIHFSYTRKSRKKAHILKYVTRATFRIFNPAVSKHFKGFRLSQTWGEWPDETKINYQDEGELLEASQCTCCNKEGVASAIDWKQGKSHIDGIRPNTMNVEGVTFQHKTLKDSKFYQSMYEDDPPDDSPKVKRKPGLIRVSEMIAQGVTLFHIQAGYYYSEESYIDHENPLNYNELMKIEVEKDTLQLVAELQYLRQMNKKSPSQWLRKQIAIVSHQVDQRMNKLVLDDKIIDPSKKYSGQKQTGLFQ